MLEAFKSKNTPESRIITIVGPGTAVNGRLTSTGSIRVEGRVSGLVQSEAEVMVLASGRVLADIIAQQIIISGEVEGDVTAANRLEITRGAKVVGNITAPRILIDEDVVFEGRCTMHAPEAPSKQGAAPKDAASGKRKSKPKKKKMALPTRKSGKSSKSSETSPGGFMTRDASGKSPFDRSEEDLLPLEAMEMLESEAEAAAKSVQRSPDATDEDAAPRQEELEVGQEARPAAEDAAAKADPESKTSPKPQ